MFDSPVRTQSGQVKERQRVIIYARQVARGRTCSVVRVVVRDFKERKNVYFFKSPTTTRTTTQFQSPGRPCGASLHGAIVKNTLGFQGVVVSRPGRLAVACAGQSVLWAMGLTCDLRRVRLTCDLRRPLQNRVLSILVREIFDLCMSG